MSTFSCIKYNKRLWIRNDTSGEIVYTPPDYIRLINRELMNTLAQRASTKGYLDIRDIMIFESKAPRAAGYSKRTSQLEWD